MAASPIGATGATSPVRTLRWIGLWALTVAAALWAGSRLERDAAPEVAVERPGARAELTGAPGMPQARDATGAAGDTQIRAILRDELARQLSELRRPTADTEPADRAPEPGPPPMTAELATRADEASGLVDRAIEAGRWTPDDRRRFASATGELPPPALIELERRLHVAINRGAVAVVDGFPPFGPFHPAP